MTEQRQQSAKLVQTNKALAAGLASVVTALFTSKLGVAGTLIGTALTAITITLVSTILQAQIERAQTKLSGLPSAVRGRLSTQQVRIPGKQGAEPNPESPPPPEPRGGRFASFVERLRSIPGFLKGLSPAARRRILLSGALAGLVATAIALVIITFSEVVAGEPISSFVGTQRESAGETAPRTSVGSLFGGSRSTDPQNGSQQYAPQDEPARDGQFQRGNPAQQPGGGQYQEDPAQQPADPAQEQPGGTPQDETPPQQQPDAEPAPGGELPAASPDR
jgi:hypothetical protein